MAAASLLALVAGLVAGVTGADRRVVHHRDVTLGDVAMLSGEGARGAERLKIARLWRSQALLSRASLAELIRRALPAASVRGDTSGAVLLESDGRGRPAPRLCRSAAHDLAPGEAISNSDLADAPCIGAPPAQVLFDRATGIIRAARELKAGDYLGALLVPERLAVKAGDPLTLVSRGGAATIRRQVTAAQAARPGQRRLFVRTAEGELISVRLEEKSAQ